MIVRIKLFILLVCYSFAVTAETGFRVGTIEHMRVHETQMTQWAPPYSWITLNGVTSAGTCATFFGNVLFVADSDQMLSMLLAVQFAGKEVSVHYNDTLLINGFCKAIYITTGNPPPANY